MCVSENPETLPVFDAAPPSDMPRNEVLSNEKNHRETRWFSQQPPQGLTLTSNGKLTAIFAIKPFGRNATAGPS